MIKLKDISLNELTSEEIKYWAIHADIQKQLNTPKYRSVYKRLSAELKGERLDALNYFWKELFSKL